MRARHPHGRRRLHAGHALALLLAILLPVLLFRAVAMLRAPVPPPSAPTLPERPDETLLSTRDLFFPHALTGGEGLPVTTLPLSLHGIRLDGTTGRGSAIIAGEDGRQTLYEVGDDLGDGATLVAIAADHVVLAHTSAEGDGRETLWLDSAGADYDARTPLPHAREDTDLPDNEEDQNPPSGPPDTGPAAPANYRMPDIPDHDTSAAAIPAARQGSAR